MSVTSDIGPFAIVPEWLMRSGVSAGAVRLFAELALMADRKTGETWPSRKTLASRLGVASLRTIDGYLAELETAGAVRKEPRFVGENERSSSLYLVQFAAPGHAVSGATPRAVSRSENQSHSEPESRTISKTASAVPPNRPDEDQMYLAGRLGAAWDQTLTEKTLQKLNNAHGRVAVTDAMRQLHGFPPGEAIRSLYAYIEAICTQEVRPYRPTG